MSRKRLKIRALLVDLDGTLVETGAILVDAAKQALCTIGSCQVDPQIGVEVARLLQSNHPLDSLLRANGITGAAKQQFMAAYLDAFHGLTPTRTRPLPNVQETLRTLSKRVSLALVTRRNVSRERLADELERLQLIQFFETAVTSQDVNQPQPSPEIMLKAAYDLGVPINECVVVSDSIVDIQAGKAAGVKTIAVLSGLFNQKELEQWKPDFIIADVNGLPDLLDQLL